MKSIFDQPEWRNFELGGPPPSNEKFQEMFRELQKMIDEEEAEITRLKLPWWRRILGAMKFFTFTKNNLPPPRE